MTVLKSRGAGICGTLCRIIMPCILSFICAAAVGAELENQTEGSFPVDGAARVVINAATGDIIISSWDRSEVLAKAVKKAAADSSEEMPEPAEGIEITMDRVEDRIEITAKIPPDSQLDAPVEYNIFIPENIDLEVNAVDGSVYIRGNRGKEKITTTNGSIELMNIAGSVSAKTVNGSIYAEILFDGESSFATTDGSVDVHIGDNFSVPISVTTVSGPVRIFIPERFSAEVDAVAPSGKVSISTDLPFEGSVEDYSLHGSIFGGGPLMKLRSVNGDIALKAEEYGAEEMEEMPQDEEEQIEATEEEETPVRELGVPRAEVVKTLKPPIIDGRLDDDCWENAGRIEGFVWSNGIEKPNEPTEAYLLWDDRNFYIGVRCSESVMDAIRICNTENDSATLGEDILQIFIDPTPEKPGEYYHLIVNPIGTVFDQEIASVNVQKRRIEKSKLGTKWDSGGLFDTDMGSGFWAIEAGMPLSALKAHPEEGDVWRFNLYRIEKRREEHTYWSAIYNSQEWPHVPDRFGELTFVTADLVAKPPLDQPIPSEEALTIADIKVEGNDKISQEEIMDAMDLSPGDMAGVDVLSHAKMRLESLGWFVNVGMDLTESEAGIDLVVKVLEKQIISPAEVQIRGAQLFTEEQIMGFFNIGSFKTTVEDMDLKCRLIENLYKSKGYEMPTVTNSFISDTLIIEIDEGTIDRIEVRGNHKVRTRDILDAFALKSGMPYRRNEIENALNTMKAQLPYFSSVKWEPGRSDDGLNILYIDVVEADLIKAGLSGIGEFSRVHGLRLGLGSELKSTYGGAKGYWKFSYGFSSKIWNYELGMEKSWFRKHRSTIGIDVHRVTDTNDGELVSDIEHFIAEAILGEAWRDFYERQGYELSLAQKLISFNEFGLKFRDDEYKSLPKTNDWSLLNRSYSDDDWYQDFNWTGGRETRSREKYRPEDEKFKPENPAIEEGNMRSLIVEYTIDTRNSKQDPTTGWLNTFSAEFAGGELGGDFDFNFFQANIRRYNRLSGNQFFTFRMKAAMADRKLPALHPRKLYLGGIGTLRGYRFKEFAGDVIFLINAEYWLTTNWPPGLGVVFFMDTGYAWPYDMETRIEDLKTDIGLGFQLGGLRINLASPVSEAQKDTVFSARLARMF